VVAGAIGTRQHSCAQGRQLCTRQQWRPSAGGWRMHTVTCKFEFFKRLQMEKLSTWKL
jgi:hypothetical protein